MFPRPPIVTILGHVDHGKTSLLDFIRKSRLTSKEQGGITQRIGAYEIDTKIKGYKNSRITFIDTPGHEAFSQLRSRGANVADIALLVVDAKDSLMPQTIESISHIKLAKIPFIVVINKIDLPDANPNKIKTDLMKYEIMVEDKGGQTPTVNVSAKTGANINELLETILLVTSDLNLSYNPTNPFLAYVIETKKNKRGIVVSSIIKEGELKTGDVFYSGTLKGKVKALINDLGNQVEKVAPATPFELLGFSELPEVGSLILSTPATQEIKNDQVDYSPKPIDMKTFLNPEPEEKKLSVIIKADSQGTLDAICVTLCKKDNVEIILQAVGEINKSDVFLAKTTKAIVIGFAVDFPKEVVDLAKQEKVIVKTYNIIYELLAELEEVADILKEKEEKERHLKGEAKILANFIIEREKIYGIKIVKGKINLGDELEVYRQNKLIGKTKLVSLKTRAKTVTEVKKDHEAGMVFSPPLDIIIGDVVKSIL